MKNNTVINELPLVLDVNDVAYYLKISKSMAYNLFKTADFPTLRIGSRVVTPKKAFLEWVNDNTNNSE